MTATHTLYFFRTGNGGASTMRDWQKAGDFTSMLNAMTVGVDSGRRFRVMDATGRIVWNSDNDAE